jgi:hypothetical protein
VTEYKPLRDQGNIKPASNDDTVLAASIRSYNSEMTFIDNVNGVKTLGELSGGGAPSGPAGGDLGGTYPNPIVGAITTTAGPQSLTINGIAGDQVLMRSGNTVVGINASLAPQGLAWRYDDASTVDSNPAGGFFRLNDLIIGNATFAYISDIGGALANTARDALLNLEDGDFIFWGGLEKAHEGEHASWLVTGAPIEATGYVKIPIGNTDTGGPYLGSELYGMQIIKVPAARGSAGAGAFRYNSNTTMADPGSGNMRLNDASQVAVTEVAVSATNRSGNDVSNLLALLDVGNTIFMQEAGDGSKSQVYDVTAPAVDNGTWLQISVAHVQQGDNPLLTNTDVSWLLFGAGGGGGGSGDFDFAIPITSPHAIENNTGSVYSPSQARRVVSLMVQAPVDTEGAGSDFTFQLQYGTATDAALTTIDSVTVTAGTQRGENILGASVLVPANSVFVVNTTAIGSFPVGTSTRHKRFQFHVRTTP